ncbi:hypothetical protein HMPREF9374_1900 [Desmospora sp. 8437]|nr:hypothetical protein HMPREF9374_1900 [Desmospora sp. 8437]
MATIFVAISVFERSVSPSASDVEERDQARKTWSRQMLWYDKTI